MIELLVVIAIIAILAAIIFPTFSQVREQARQTSCMSQMQDIGRACNLYALDNGGRYPPTLLGYPRTKLDIDFKAAPRINPLSTTYTYCTGGTPVDASQNLSKPLVGRRSYLTDNNVGQFHCPDSANKDQTAIVTPVWPAPIGRTDPIYALNRGNFAVDTCPGGSNKVVAQYYLFDSYDVGPQLDPTTGRQVTGADGKPVYELHYTPDWTGKPLSPDTDAQNQLKYPDAPGTTVLTWCTYHAAVNGSDKTLVLLKSGTTKPVKATDFAQQGPLQFKF